MNGCSFSASFAAKFELVFVLTLENASFWRFIIKPTKRAWVLLKNGTTDFQISPPFERLACFYVTISGNFERLQYFNFKTNFLEKKTFFKKLEYPFLVEKTKIENASFPHKTAISEANVKTNKMVSTKLTSQRTEFCQEFLNFCENFVSV